MNDWAYILRPIQTRQLVNPHASMEVPVADLKRAPGGKGSKGGDPINLYWAELMQLREAPVSIKARHFTPFSSTGICAPVSPLSFIFNTFPSSPLAINVAPSGFNCHWGPSSSICSSPTASPVLPSSSESVGRSANSSVSPSVSERLSTSTASCTVSFFVVGGVAGQCLSFSFRF